MAGAVRYQHSMAHVVMYVLFSPQFDAQKKKRGYTGVFKRLRRNGHLEYQKAANSSAQTVTLEAQPQEKAPVCEA